MSNIKLYNGDCLDVKLQKCRLLFTDIPYGVINRKSNGLRKLDKDVADVETFDLYKFLKHIYDCFDVCVIFCANEQYSDMFKFFYEKQKQHKGTVRQLIWAKNNPSPMNGEYVYLSGTENAVWFKKKGTGKLNCKCRKNVFQYPTGSSKFHPTEKNHKLLTEIIENNTNENDLVIDTCMGSGSCGIVCKQLNRDFTGIELDKKYFEIAKNRIGE